MVPEDAALWCEPKYVVLTGPVRERIIEAAAERKADLIVMGAHPTEHLGAATHLPASIAHKVVAEAFCPVLTVRG
jgi:nucleotide-binding universal stress UspA family protein